MDINELFDGIAKDVERFAEELAEQRLQEKTRLRRPVCVLRTGRGFGRQMSRTGRGPKVKPEKTENEGRKEKEIHPDFPKIE